ncbi:unnamed protein product [marine sediment metagenome]|uniref:Uncharacterized protein n=1 Tax=marine sediment metagenome TaxID=412755 RepID=X0TEQ1_9ZZZZ
MWSEWLHIKGSNRIRERPVTWWRQLETAPRAAMPFAHLFPRPHQSKRHVDSEAVRLVRDLVRVRPEHMEDVVQHYQSVQEWEPVEASQIVSISRLNDAETAEWGTDGGQVVEWFDHGDLMHAWPTKSPTGMDISEGSTPGGIARVRTWFRGLFPKQLELANAEF